MNLRHIGTGLRIPLMIRICRLRVRFKCFYHYFVDLTQKVLNLESVVLSKTEVIRQKSDVEAQLD